MPMTIYGGQTGYNGGQIFAGLGLQTAEVDVVEVVEVDDVEAQFGEVCGACGVTSVVTINPSVPLGKAVMELWLGLESQACWCCCCCC